MRKELAFTPTCALLNYFESCLAHPVSNPNTESADILFFRERPAIFISVKKEERTTATRL